MSGRWARAPRRDAERLEGAALIEAMAADLARLSPQLRKAAACLVRERGLPRHCRITDFAQLSGTTPVTIVRLAKRYGFRGYYELKFACLEDTAAPAVVRPPRPAVAHALSHEALGPAMQGAVQAMGALSALLLSAPFAQVARWLLDVDEVVVHAARPFDVALASAWIEAFRQVGIDARSSDTLPRAGPAEALVLELDLSGSHRRRDPVAVTRSPGRHRHALLTRLPPAPSADAEPRPVLLMPEGGPGFDLQILTGLVSAWACALGALRAPH